MAVIYLTTGGGLAVIRQGNGEWIAEVRLQGLPVYCVDADPLRPERVYCGTFGRGLWRSDDAGDSWRSVGEGITYPEVMAVAVSAASAARMGPAWCTRARSLARSSARKTAGI